MATATPKQHAPRTERGTDREPERAAVTFRVDEDNGGEYRWALVDAGGESLGRSVAFATYDAADTAAGLVRDALGSPQVQRRPLGDRPVDPFNRRRAAHERGESDTERRLDGGGLTEHESVH